MNGKKHGKGKLQLKDGTRYKGEFDNDMCSGLGILTYPDGARYEGEFLDGWFHGLGIFYRSDGMKFEGEFRGGKIDGYGLVTFNDNNHGFPRNEGCFKDCHFVQRKGCDEVIQKAEKIALMARLQFETER